MSSRRAREEAAEAYRARVEAERAARRETARARRDADRARRGLPPYHCWSDMLDEVDVMVVLFGVLALGLYLLDHWTGGHLGFGPVLVVAATMTAAIRYVVQGTEPDEEAPDGDASPPR